MDDVFGLGWLPVNKRTEFHLLRTTHSALYGTHWPSYLTLYRRQTTRNPHSSAISQLIVPLETETFEDSASRLFNSLPNDMKRETNAKTSREKFLNYLKLRPNPD